MSSSNPTYPFYLKAIIAVVLLVLTYFFCFHHLDWLSIQHWDEGLFAMRASYLAKTGMVLENFDSFPFMNSHANTKPPLVTFVQAFLVKHMDNYILAIRLPSAIAQVLLALFILWMGKVGFKKYAIGVLGFLIFLSTRGLYVGHIARFGDQDMPFIFFLFVSLGLLFHYLQTQKAVYIIGSIMFFFFAYYTKSILAYVVFPGVLFYLLIEKKFERLKNPKNYLYAVVFLLPLIISLLVSDSHHGNAKRFTVALDHYNVWHHYFDLFVAEAYLMPWIFFVLLGLVLSLFLPNKQLKYLSIQALVIFSLMSFAKMRLHHYIAILYPIAALIAAYALYVVLEGFYKNLSIDSVNTRKFIIGGSLVLLFAFAFNPVKEYTYKPVEIRDEHLFGEFLDKYHKGVEPVKEFTIVTNYLPLTIAFYADLFEWKYNYTINHSDITNQLYAEGRVLMIHKEEYPEFLTTYETEIISETKKIVLARVVSLKE